MTVTLITGANKGIGRETARQLIGHGHRVWVGARDQDRGRRAATELGAHFVQLDVTDDRSVEQALDLIQDRDGQLDVLVNNAGIPDNTIGVHGLSGSRARTVLDTNVAGVVRVTQAALPLLERSQHPVIVNVSSGLGSFGANTSSDRPESQTPLIVYAASKAAVAMLTLKYAQALPAFTINAACPGLTDTDFVGDFPGGQPVEDAAGVVVRLALLGPDAPSGTVQENDGPLDW
jgi:NAD(P)-dependent dehydrogenase (short-subunit alcohol dehydrogenase family)